MKKLITGFLVISIILMTLVPSIAFAGVDEIISSETVTSGNFAFTIEEEPNLIYMTVPTDEPNVFNLVAVDKKTRSILINSTGRMEIVWMPGARSLSISINIYAHPTSSAIGIVSWFEEGSYMSTSHFTAICNGNATLVNCPLSYKSGKDCEASVVGLAVDGISLSGFDMVVPFTM